MLSGPEVLDLLWRRFNPTAADRTPERRPGAREQRLELVGALDAVADAREAARAAHALRELVAGSAIDCADQRHLRVDRDLEQALYVATLPDATEFGWLLDAMQVQRPFTLTVHVHALDRLRERARFRSRHRRLFGVNRGAELRGRIPDYEMLAQEEELSELLKELSGHERASAFEVSIYQSIRERGPDPDPVQLAEAVEQASREIIAASDARVNAGQLRQLELWQSSLPLGRDLARMTRKYVTRHVGDTVPLVGTGCGSPQGVPFAFTDPGREVALINPFDPAHDNGTLLVNARSGRRQDVPGQRPDRAAARARHAGVRARSRRPLRVPVPARARRPAPDDRRIQRRARRQPVGRRGPGEPADREDQLPRRAARAAGRRPPRRRGRLRPGRARAQPARGRHPIRLRARRARRTSRRARRCCARSCAAAPTTRPRQAPRRSPRRCARSASGSPRSSTTAPTPTCSTARPPCPPTRRWSPSTRARSRASCRPPCCSCSPSSVTRRIEARGLERLREADGGVFAGRSMLVIDEAWKLVERRATGEWVNDIARRSRHLGLFLVAISQQLSDFAGPYGKALLRNSTQQLFLRQSPDELAYIKDAARLSDAEVRAISRLKTVKRSYSQAYWINGTRGRGTIALRVGPTEYGLATSDPVNDLPRRTQMLDACDGDAWQALEQLAAEGWEAQA